MENNQIIHAKSRTIPVFFRATFGLIGLAGKAVADELNETLDNNFSAKKAKKKKVGYWTIFTPFHVFCDTTKKTVTFKKRHWYLIGCDEETFVLKNISHVKVKKGLWGADIAVAVGNFTGGQACSVSRKKADLIKEIILKESANV